MHYKPLEKKITFSEVITKNPNYHNAMIVIKACGSREFKDWLIGWCQKYQKSAQKTADGVLVGRIADLLIELVNKPTEPTSELLSNAAQLCKENESFISIAELLVNILNFLVKVQRIEKQITEIEQGIKNGTWRKPYTKADLTPRSRENW